MTLTERRTRYRNVLAGSECIHPASVFDPISARMAEAAGFEIGMMAGSTASGTVLAAPDIVVLYFFFCLCFSHILFFDLP